MKFSGGKTLPKKRKNAQIWILIFQYRLKPSGLKPATTELTPAKSGGLTQETRNLQTESLLWACTCDDRKVQLFRISGSDGGKIGRLNMKIGRYLWCLHLGINPVFAVVVLTLLSLLTERDLRVGKLRSKHLTHTSKKGAKETDVQSDVQRCGNPKCLLFIIILSVKLAINWKYTTRFHP